MVDFCAYEFSVVYFSFSFVMAVFCYWQTCLGTHNSESLDYCAFTQHSTAKSLLSQIQLSLYIRKIIKTCIFHLINQVLVGLRYLAKGDLLSEVADIHGVSR